MERIVNCVTFRNVERFIEFLDKNLKCTYGEYDLDACLDDLDNHYSISGCPNYELSSLETKSGIPECIDYDVEDILDDEPNVSESYDRVITF